MRRLRGDRGAAAIEFALVLPLLLAVALGTFTGGVAYNRKLSMTHAARDAARHGAVLYFDPGAGAVPNSWLDDVACRAVRAAAGEMGDVNADCNNYSNPAPGQSVCVAYVGNSPAGPADYTKGRTQTEDDSPVYRSGPGGHCFADGLSAQPRVQMLLQRQTEFQTLLVASNITLKAEAVARYERVTT